MTARARAFTRGEAHALRDAMRAQAKSVRVEAVPDCGDWIVRLTIARGRCVGTAQLRRDFSTDWAVRQAVKVLRRVRW